MSEGAGIKCAVCSGRPYPAELGPPDARETFDLLKVGGRWLCEEHRSAKAPRTSCATASPIADGIEKSRRELAKIVDRGDFDIGTKEALRAVIDRLDRAAEGTADGH